MDRDQSRGDRVALDKVDKKKHIFSARLCIRLNIPT